MINDFVFDDFSSTVADTVHLSYPQQLILCFELFGYAFLFSEFSNKAVKHFCCFFVDICKVVVQLAGRQKVVVENLVVLPLFL